MLLNAKFRCTKMLRKTIKMRNFFLKWNVVFRIRIYLEKEFKQDD